MGINKQTGLILGIGVAAVGGFFLWKAMQGDKMNIIEQYQDASDFEAADVIRDKIKPAIFIQGFVDPFSTTKDMVIVGGQMVNPVYALLENNGVFPAIEESMQGTGFIFVRQAYGHTYYGVAGWLAADTMAAANFIASAGLPTQDIEVPT